MSTFSSYYLLPVLLSGCASSPTQVNQQTSKQYTESFIRVHAVMPSYQLLWHVCRHRTLTGNWPSLTGQIDKDVFRELYIVQTADKDLQLSYLLSGVNIPVQFLLTSKGNTSDTYSMRIRANFPHGDYTHNMYFNCTNNGLTKEELTDATTLITSVFNLHKATESHHTSSTAVSPPAKSLIIRTILCTLLTLTPEQCRT